METLSELASILDYLDSAPITSCRVTAANGRTFYADDYSDGASIAVDGGLWRCTEIDDAYGDYGRLNNYKVFERIR
jgi:hypothetical protein